MRRYWIKAVIAEAIRLIAAVYIWQHYIRPILTSKAVELSSLLICKGALACLSFIILVWFTNVKKPAKKLPPYRL